ncbi:transposase, partial [Streptomyces clavifer]|uniref:transposase n=1 Tax=Streptomyces clavifer TaxID=68188 RepID=UPI0036768C17
SFAALCGVAPVPASSGKTNRHRLSRGGDRAAKRGPLPDSTGPHGQRRPHPRLRGPPDRSRPDQEGIIRLLKRAIAREAFRYLTTTVTVPDIADLRPARQGKNITLTAVAHHFGVWPAVISCIERGTRRDDNLANAYRDWLVDA